jgi:diguanylate cyclase (GGDEF)-like protein
MNAPSGTPFDAQPDLTVCDREPIHTPGHVQPHGVLIATAPGGDRITHVSENIGASTGLSAAEALDRGLADVLGAPAFQTLSTALLSGRHAPSNVFPLTLPLPLRPQRNIMVHRHLGRTLVEIEEALDENRLSVGITQGVISSLSEADSVESLCEIAAETLRRLTGYDRVLVYRFDPEGHGSVITEEKAADLEPFLDLRYPASDIPRQARRLYVQQRVRAIPDVLYTPQRLIAAREGAGEVDMTFCALRGVSPVHLEYMRNMGVQGTMAISLLRDSELWGMIVCHHRQPLRSDANLRSLCGLIGQLMSVLLHKASDAASLAERLKRHHIIAGLQRHLESADNVALALSAQGPAILGLVGADGAVIKIGGRGFRVGVTPPLDTAAEMMSAMRRIHGEDIIAIADAARPDGVGAGMADIASGILMMPIQNNPDDAIAWFRPEQPHTVRWGGDPRKPTAPGAVAGTLSPRTSFSAWSEQVRGQSQPWSAADVEAAQDLRRAVTGALLWQAEAQLAHLSAYDPLTTLANRRTLKSLMDQCAAAGEHTRAAMLFFDLDRFKMINDVLGHGAGDHVLVEVAVRLRRLTPAAAVAGRLGGDEFVVFWPGAGQAEAESLAASLLEAMAAPVVYRDQILRVTVSIGIAWTEIGGLDRLMQEADEAMYAAKRQGGAGVAVFHPELHAKAFDSLRLEQELFRALEEDQISVDFQPIYSLPGRTLTGFEALARWRHPGRGWISPAEFIPAAEGSGLITRLGAKIMELAIRQLGRWLRLNGALRMAINVSSLQLVDESLADLVRDLLAREGVPAGRIYLEVTESVLMKEAAVTQLHRLRTLGVAIALDDFGTGYSSLAYLQDLPIDVVKIDRKFVSSLGSSEQADRVFRAIVNLVQTFGMRLVAEGCETEEQLAIIAETGCNAVQGWLLGRPAPAEDIVVVTADALRS